jgi:hypothetical protein
VGFVPAEVTDIVTIRICTVEILEEEGVTVTVGDPSRLVTVTEAVLAAAK